MSEPVPISAIVCNLNGRRFLPRLIESLKAQQGVAAQIVVVDRESTDGSLEYLRAVPGGVTIVSEPACTGLVAGYHAAASRADHELLFFCNEDLWLDRDCLLGLVRHISLAERIGAADPWQWSYDQTRPLHRGVRFHAACLDRISCFPPRGFDFLAPLQSGDPVPFGSAGAILIHRRMYDEIGGWDPSFFMDFDDVDFFVNGWQRGWRCVTAPEARVFHAVGQSTFQAGPPPREVARLRRVGAESNRAAIVLKYFTGVSLLWAAVLLVRPLVGNLLRLRFAEAGISLRAMRRTFRRFPGIRRFRADNRDLLRSMPGQRFFTDPRFQI
jgi:GT2 family glycosyltransferase